ncbi:MAG: radical SAM protein [Treponema sp.]|nr:radical SAM protein [Treponema sp.]
MMAALNGARWSAADDAADADLIIINSCGFIESAKRESINAVLGWRKLYPGKKILLAGCLAQRYAAELAESLPEADALFGIEDVLGIVGKANALFVGTRDWGLGTRGCCSDNNITSELDYDISKSDSQRNPKGGASENRGSPLDPHSPVPNAAEPHPLSPISSNRPLLSMPGSAYVKISEGCDNCCSFCAIPLIRGPLCCRTAADIVDECRGLLARGIRELCIIGQDIGSYRSGSSGLPELLAAVAELPGNFWVRLLYIHPDHFPLPVLDIMERDGRFLPYFDIPFQHASPNILAAMNRRGTAKEYLALARTIRRRLPASVIRTTFLVGFPGETEDDFASLLDFQAKLRADWLGCFPYSREEGTPAYAMKARVPKKIAAARKREAEDRQVKITERRMNRFIGQNLDLLPEEKFDAGEGLEGKPIWLGRLYCHAPEVDGAAVVAGETAPLAAGALVPCTVIARRGFDLEVRLVGSR